MRLTRILAIAAVGLLSFSVAACNTDTAATKGLCDNRALLKAEFDAWAKEVTVVASVKREFDLGYAAADLACSTDYANVNLVTLGLAISRMTRALASTEAKAKASGKRIMPVSLRRALSFSN